MRGPFTYYIEGVPAENVEILLRDVILNPWAPQDELQILKLRALSFRYTISEKTLADTLAANVTGLKNVKTRLRDGELEVDARYGDIPVSTELYFFDDGNEVGVRVERLKAGGVPFPRPLLGYASSQLQPCAERDRLWFALGETVLSEGPDDTIVVSVGDPTGK
jgi:hypothetical protein